MVVASIFREPLRLNGRTDMLDYQPIDYRLRCHTKRTDLPADVLRDIGEAYAEIEQLRHDLDGSRLAFAAMRAERDEARQEICIRECDTLGAVFGGSPATPQDYAKEMGWNCFKENTDD